jgi:hypothetical protein
MACVVRVEEQREGKVIRGVEVSLYLQRALGRDGSVS